MSILNFVHNCARAHDLTVPPYMERAGRAKRRRRYDCGGQKRCRASLATALHRALADELGGTYEMRPLWDCESRLANSLKLLELSFYMGEVITPHFERLIDRFIASGRFNNRSGVIRAGLRLLEEHEAGVSAPTREDLDRIIHEALTDPRPWKPAEKLLRRRRRQ